jgi:hypothetical protein
MISRADGKASPDHFVKMKATMKNCYIAKERPALLCRKILLNTFPTPKKDFSKTPLLATTSKEDVKVRPEAKAPGPSEKYIENDHVFFLFPSTRLLLIEPVTLHDTASRISQSLHRAVVRPTRELLLLGR